MIEESLNNAIKRIQKKKKMQEASGLAARMSAAYTKNKDIIKARKGIKKPKKGGALVTTKGSAIKKTGSSALTPVKDARAGITKPEPEAKDQTINVKATEVGGDLAKSKSGGVTKSKVGSMSNSGKKTVDPKKNTVTSGAQQGAKHPEILSKDSKERDLKRDIDQNSDERRRKKAEKAEAEAKAKRSRIAKGVKTAAKSAIGGAAAAYGSSSFNVKEEKTFAQFVDDAVPEEQLDEFAATAALTSPIWAPKLTGAAMAIAGGLTTGAGILGLKNYFQSKKNNPSDEVNRPKKPVKPTPKDGESYTGGIGGRPTRNLSGRYKTYKGKKDQYDVDIQNFNKNLKSSSPNAEFKPDNTIKPSDNPTARQKIRDILNKLNKNK